MSKLIIFDLDGTLLNTIGDLAVCSTHTLAQRGLPQHSYDDYCNFVGNGITRLVERALPEELRTEEYIAATRRDFVAYYTENIDHHTTPYEGIYELLEQLKRAGATLAVASNKFHAGTKKLIDKFFGDFSWKAIYGNRDGFPLKPDKALLELIMGECGFSAEDTWMVGDSAVDIATAQAVGAHSIGVTWGFRARQELLEQGAEYIVDKPAEIFSTIFE